MAPATSDDPTTPSRLSVAEVVTSLVHQLPIGLAIDHADGRPLYANRAATSLREGPGGPPLDVARHEIDLFGRRYAVTTMVDASQHRAAEEELTRRAFFDDLTGLPKRDLFAQTVDNMIAERCPPFALSFIDIDNFKYVNDYYGHSVGDQLLVKIVQRIVDGMRPTDLLARVGGDEFILLTMPIETIDEPGCELDRLSQRFRDPFFIDGFEIFSSASIGVSFYPAHGAGYALLRANADSAMYRVKGATKGGIALFESSLGLAAAERMEVEQRVRLAIRDKRLLCAYQPKVNFRTDAIVGVEVLLRWQDANGDIQPPGDILRIATELGLMDEIALTVVDQVTSEIDLLSDAFGPDASISLNVAAKQATDLRFMAKLVATLQATGYAERFVLELTEEAFLSKGAFQDKILPMIREIGAGVSIDDFGVGYSSLSALAEITADELKVDRSFITDIHKRPRNQSILKMIELLASSLGMRVVVEGVETAEELTYLMAATRINCAQGYYFAKPMILRYGASPRIDTRKSNGGSREIFAGRMSASR